MNPVVKAHFATYPDHVSAPLVKMRALIFALAEQLTAEPVEESLKWGEPSYRVKTGSPVRIDWKPNTPDHYYLFFHCQTKLVDTFRELYGEQLRFEGNRAIVLSLTQPLPEAPIRHCLTLALTYQQRKHLPLLGA
ncbi:DUF1801 domain-containing protein [Motilimonas eburnea]|uniref:DUF1801 domain-containing protein n=1 Tax=Motilimonas eburnea TaxID=1737488 RepID=UPI001E4877D6|nr:DUF1801 domain-containing protein [Motilimonas eburnea]MCE2570507.1 DUF1801 domain-containing protein [Motilimonas eburnea]